MPDTPNPPTDTGEPPLKTLGSNKPAPGKKPKKSGVGLAAKTGIGFAALLIMIVAGLLIAPNFVDWNGYKAEIVRQARKQTGLDIRLEGDISLGLLPTPSLLVEDVAVLNVEGAAADKVLSLESLEARVDPWPLLAGTLRVETVRLVAPVIEIETLADGQTNIEKLIATAKEAAGDAPARADASSGPGGDGAGGATRTKTGLAAGLRLDNFVVQRGLIVYRDRTTGAVERISDIDAEIVAASLEGPFQARGGLNARNVPVEFDILVRKLIQGRTAPVVGSIGLAPGATSLAIDGALTDLDGAPSFKGGLKIKGRNLAALARGILGDQAPTLPGFLGQDFELAVNTLFAGPEGVTARDMALGFGSAKATGGLTLDMGKDIDFAADLAVDRIDLDHWLALPDIPGKQVSSPTPLPDRAGIARRDAIASAADAETGKLRAAPLIPANMAGSIGVRVETIAFQGQTVRQTRLSAEVGNGEITLSQVSARLPGSTDVAVFGFIGGTAETPTFEGNLESNSDDPRGALKWLKIPDMDMPSDRLRGLKLRSRIVGTPKRARFDDIDIGFDSSRLTGAVTLSLGERLAVGADLTLDGIDLDAYSPESAARKSSEPEAEAKTEASAAATTGKPKSSAGSPIDFRALKALGDFDADIKARVKKAVYRKTAIRDFVADASLHDGALNVRAITVEDFAGTSLSLRGALSDLGSGPKMRDLRFEADVGDLNALARAFQIDPPEEAGAIRQASLVLRGRGPFHKPDIDATLKAAGAVVRVGGGASLVPLPGFKGKVAVKHGDLEKLLKILKIDYNPAGPLGALDFSADIAASPTTVAVDRLKARIGETTMNGKATASLAGTKPDIALDLAFGALRVDPYLPKPDGAPLSGHSRPRTASASGGPVSVSPQAGGQWPTDPLSLGVMRAVDARVAATAQSIVHNAVVVRDADIAFALANGRLTTERLTGRLFGGDLDGDLTLTSEPVEASLKVGLKGLRIGQALRAVAGGSPASGRLDLDMDLKGRGRSMAEIVQNLSGGGAISAKALDARGVAQGSVLAPLLGLVGGIHRLSSTIGGRKDAAIADATASFNIVNGVGSTGDLRVESALVRGSAAGTVDLPGWTVNLSGQLHLARNAIGDLLSGAMGINPDARVPFTIQGPLDDPTTTADTSDLVNSAGIPGVKADGKAGKIINKILPGLLRGGSDNGGPASGTGQRGGKITPQELLKGVLRF